MTVDGGWVGTGGEELVVVGGSVKKKKHEKMLDLVFLKIKSKKGLTSLVQSELELHCVKFRSCSAASEVAGTLSRWLGRTWLESFPGMHQGRSGLR